MINICRCRVLKRNEFEICRGKFGVASSDGVVQPNTRYKKRGESKRERECVRSKERVVCCEYYVATERNGESVEK